jgi:hypothetical protein
MQLEVDLQLSRCATPMPLPIDDSIAADADDTDIVAQLVVATAGPPLLCTVHPTGVFTDRIHHITRHPMRVLPALFRTQVFM